MTDFRSDNEAPAAPEILDAVVAANGGPAHAYGADAWSARLDKALGALFETGVAVYPVATGTAANVLSLAELTPPHGAVYCHEEAHANVDECGAPEFFTGGAKLIGLPGAHGRIDPDGLGRRLAATGFHGEHEALPTTLSLTQATEAGTVYPLDELAALTGLARARGMGVHMDGARLANALVRLGCAPADATWRAGVDLLSFGATKNGALAAEAVVDFRPGAKTQMRRRRMRGGHLWSKMRYLSAQLEAYVADGLWLRLAARANAGAARLAEGLAALPGVALLHPVEANALFVRAAPAVSEALRAAGFEFHPWPGAEGAIRLVVPWCVEDAEVERFLACAQVAARGA